MKDFFGVDVSLFRKYDLSPDAVCAFTGITMAAQKCKKFCGENYYFCSFIDIVYSLYDRRYTKKEEDSVNKGIHELLDKKIIRCEEFVEYKYLLAHFPYYMEKPGWTLFHRVDIRHILEQDKKNKKQILKFYMQLLGLRYGGRKISKKYKFKFVLFSQEDIARMLKLSEKTLRNYIQELMQLNIIVGAKPIKYDVGGHKNNIYADALDRKLLQDYIENELEEEYCIIGETVIPETEKDVEENKKINILRKKRDSRSYLAKYRWFKTGKKYSLEDIYYIKKACEEYNYRQIKQQEKSLAMGNIYEPTFKDMSVFDGYDFSDFERMEKIKVPGDPFTLSR